jgi:predicted nucleic acid-binding protein
VTATIGSERFVVDSSGWIEYLAEGPKAQLFAIYLETPEFVYLPTIVVYEVYKKLLNAQRAQVASWFLSQSFGFQERVIPIDVPVAEFAARISAESKLAMADAFIYAAARLNRAQLITSDHHFASLMDVTII